MRIGSRAVAAFAHDVVMAALSFVLSFYLRVGNDIAHYPLTILLAYDLGFAVTAAVVAQGVEKGALTIHADRGTSMTSKGIAELLTDLGVGRTHSRPHVSNDNPYSEAVNKTLKYCPRSLAGSARSKTPARSAPRSSITTTTSTVTPASGCTPPRRSTTARPPRSAPNAR